MRKLAVIAALAVAGTLSAQQSATTITWSNGGAAKPGQQYCLPITQENGVAVTGTWDYCPEQPSEFASPDCVTYTMPQVCFGSLYLPDLTLEGITITQGTPQPLTYNADGSTKTWQRTDVLDAPGWIGTTTQQYKNVLVRYCNRYGCKMVPVAQATGGSGTLEQVQ